MPRRPQAPALRRRRRGGPPCSFVFFFAAVVVVASLAAFAGRWGAPGLAGWPACLRLGLAVALWLAGADHLANPGRHLPMLPGFVPDPSGTVLFAGLCEIAGGVGPPVPRLRRLAGPPLVACVVRVFLADVKNAPGGVGREGLPAAAWHHWLRLCSQPLAVWWAPRAAEVIAGPALGRRVAPAARA